MDPVVHDALGSRQRLVFFLFSPWGATIGYESIRRDSSEKVVEHD
jgi:hypothetical protein